MPSRGIFLHLSPPPLQRGQDLGGYRRKIRIPGSFPHHDGRPRSDRKHALVSPVEFPEEPLHPVPDHRVPHTTADGNPDLPVDGPPPRHCDRAVIPVYGVVRGGRAFPLTNHFPVFAVGSHHFSLRQPVLYHPRPGPSGQGRLFLASDGDGKPLPPFRATSGKDLLARRRRHAPSETVRSQSAPVVRLERSFHLGTTPSWVANGDLWESNTLFLLFRLCQP